MMSDSALDEEPEARTAIINTVITGPSGSVMINNNNKRRKVRKGTRSCWECKRRKIRCIFASSEDVTCIGCQRRRAPCVSQELPEDLSLSLSMSPSARGGRGKSKPHLHHLSVGEHERIARAEQDFSHSHPQFREDEYLTSRDKGSQVGISIGSQVGDEGGEEPEQRQEKNKNKHSNLSDAHAHAHAHAYAQAQAQERRSNSSAPSYNLYVRTPLTLAEVRESTIASFPFLPYIVSH